MSKLSLQHSIQCLDMNDYQQIHDASMRVLEEVGIRLPNERALDLLKKHGARIEGQTAFIPRKLIETEMEKIPRTYEFRARNPERSLIVGKDICAQTNAGCVFVQDMKTGPRRAKIEDYANVQKIAQSLKHLNIVGAHPVNPMDVPDKYKHMYMCYETLKNTDKPVLGFCMQGWQSKQFIDMVEIAFGDTPGKRRNDQVVNVSLNPLSPLHYAKDTLDTLFEYTERGQCVFIFPHILAGVTGPIHLAGMGVLQNTEIITGMVLGRLINPEAPMVYSASSSTVCMRNARPIQASPDLVRCNQFLLEMAHNFYNVPTRTQTGMTDAKIVDSEAGLEAAGSTLFSLLGDADFIVENYGMMDNGMTTSLEMMILADEILGRTKHMLKGIPINEETLSVDIIKEMGTSADYLMHESTFENFRSDQYYKYDLTVSGEMSYEEWVKEGSISMEQRLEKRLEDILKEAPETFLSKDTDKELKRYMELNIK